MFSKADNNTTIEWRQILLNLSQQLKSEEVTEIAFLYSLPEKFRSEKQQGFAVLEKLETEGLYSFKSPKALSTVFLRIRRKDLEKQAKDLVKTFMSKKQNECPCKRKAEIKCACDSVTYHLMQGALPQIKNARKLAAQSSNKDAIEMEKALKESVKKFLMQSNMMHLLEEEYAISSTDESIGTYKCTCMNIH